jgi:hypothetical protein
MRLRPCFLILKRAGSVFREDLKIKQMPYYYFLTPNCTAYGRGASLRSFQLLTLAFLVPLHQIVIHLHSLMNLSPLVIR